MHDITIYHNPKCGTSRNTLALIRNCGVEPTIIEYLITPPSRETLIELMAQMGVGVRELLRTKQIEYEELHLNDDSWSEDGLIDAILEHPVLLNRPIVVTALGARLCRPSELVLDILPLPQQGAFFKEDGEQIINADGKRV